MADTPIDHAVNLTSLRLKVPTGTVPIPPDGYGQLHTPAPGTMALLLPDGSVVEIGGGGGGGAATALLGPGGAIDAANTNPAIGINLNAAPGTGIAFTGAFLDQYANPLGLQVDTVELSSADLLALHITPIVLRAEPAGGRTAVPMLVTFSYHPDATPYVPSDIAADFFRVTQDAGNEWAALQTYEVVAESTLDPTVATVAPFGVHTYMSTVYRGIVLRSDAAMVKSNPALAGGTMTVRCASLVV